MEILTVIAIIMDALQVVVTIVLIIIQLKNIG